MINDVRRSVVLWRWVREDEVVAETMVRRVAREGRCIYSSVDCT